MFVFKFVYKNRFSNRMEICRIEILKNNKDVAFEEFRMATHAMSYISMKKV